MKNKYRKPKITVVLMDPKQASLQVCAIGGIYIWTSAGAGVHCNSRTPNPWPMGAPCNITPKGGAGGGTSMYYTQPPTIAENNIPS
ncbi:MAG: hypothetical protein PHQ52_03605 [Candidatus Omnitrophica bacterium]|nr:hypothetical protein [Candidatus Omnitrophota bacterium]